VGAVSGFKTGRSAPTPPPLTGPIITQLGAYITPQASHELALRCRQCRAVFRSSTDGETHTQLRAHWAAKHATRLAALHPKATTPTPATPAPRPVVQRAKAVTGVKKSAPATPAPVPGATTCAATDCDTTFPASAPGVSSKAYCSSVCKSRQQRADRGQLVGAARPTVCTAPGCDEPITQPKRGKTRRYCTPACRERNRYWRDKAKAAA
jgi:uncharacterized C2H2 Zn-finger protein